MKINNDNDLKALMESGQEEILKLVKRYDHYAHMIEWSHQRNPVERRNAEILEELKKLGVTEFNNWKL